MLKNVKWVRQDPTTLPKRVVVKYADDKRDDYPSIQSSGFIPNNLGTEVVVELPVKMTASSAKKLAEIFLKNFHTAINGASFSLPLAYLQLDPSDIVTIKADDGSIYRLRVVDTSFDGVKVTVSATEEASAIYSSDAEADGGLVPDDTLTFSGPTNLVVLDVPALQTKELDGKSKVYIAAAGFYSGWKGASVAISPNEGSSWIGVNALTREATLGFCDSLLDATTTTSQKFTLDTKSVLTVRVGKELVSAPIQDILEDRSVNAAAVNTPSGWEIIQFSSATLVATGVYELTNIVRGQGGTLNLVDKHDALFTEDFLLLEADSMGIVNVEQLGVEHLFSATTFGQTFNPNSYKKITPVMGTTSSLTPYIQSFVNIPSAGKLVRFTRLSLAFNGIDSYQNSDTVYVKVYLSNTLKRTVVIDSPSTQEWLYNTAMQTEDGTTGQTVDIVLSTTNTPQDWQTVKASF